VNQRNEEYWSIGGTLESEVWEKWATVSVNGRGCTRSGAITFE